MVEGARMFGRGGTRLNFLWLRDKEYEACAFELMKKLFEEPDLNFIDQDKVEKP